MRSIWIAISTALAAVAMLAAAQQQTFIRVLTGGTSGVYYPLGITLSQIYARTIPEARPSVQATRASAENLNLLQAGRGEIAFTLGDTLSNAWKGNEEGGFKAPLTRLRTIAAIYPNYIQIFARRDSGVRTLADLKGKRISVGAAGSGTELNARAVFRAAGLSFNDFARVEFLPFGESVESMKIGRLDVTLQSLALGAPSLRELSVSMPVVVVPIPPDVVAKIGDPAYRPATIRARIYEGQDTEVPSIAVQNYLVTHEGVSEELVYRMTKALFENLLELHAQHTAAGDIRLENAARDPPAPLHPGAAKYYRQVRPLR